MFPSINSDGPDNSKRQNWKYATLPLIGWLLCYKPHFILTPCIILFDIYVLFFLSLFLSVWKASWSSSLAGSSNTDLLFPGVSIWRAYRNVELQWRTQQLQEGRHSSVFYQLWYLHICFNRCFLHTWIQGKTLVWFINCNFANYNWLRSK